MSGILNLVRCEKKAAVGEMAKARWWQDGKSRGAVFSGCCGLSLCRSISLLTVPPTIPSLPPVAPPSAGVLPALPRAAQPVSPGPASVRARLRERAYPCVCLSLSPHPECHFDFRVSKRPSLSLSLFPERGVSASLFPDFVSVSLDRAVSRCHLAGDPGRGADRPPSSCVE